jgi:hypothetical protein
VIEIEVGDVPVLVLVTTKPVSNPARSESILHAVFHLRGEVIDALDERMDADLASTEILDNWL